MNCNRIISGYIELEDRTRVPLMLRLHMLFCRECREEMRALEDMFDSLESDAPYRAGINLTPTVMDLIRRENSYVEKTISGIKWVAIGTIIFFSMLLINFSESFLWLKDTFGVNYTLPVSIVMGFAFTAYASVVIGCNYEQIKKFIELHSRWRFK